MTIKVLVVDDMVFFRKMLSSVVGDVDGFTLTGTAHGGQTALKKLAQEDIDVVLLDVYMPEMDGLETLKKIKEQFPSTIVVMISAVAERDASVVVDALANGALDFIRKPDEDSFEKNIASLGQSMNAVARIIKMRVAFNRSSKGTATASKQAPRPAVPSVKQPSATLPRGGRFSIVVVGISTGGPNALGRFLPTLPAHFPLPILLVQHMPEHFTASLAKSLDARSAVEVVEGKDGMLLTAGRGIIAPGGQHMQVGSNENDEKVVKLNSDPPVNSCRPAVDVLFESVADVYRDKKVLALVLTGMGSDGEKGVKTLKRGQCYCITESAESCVIYGMPEAVDRSGLSDLSMSIEKIGPYITSLCTKVI